MGWYGVDLDGTLAVYTDWRGTEHIGEPIESMVLRVQEWLAEGKDVRIFTARVGPQHTDPDIDARMRQEAADAITVWCVQHIGRPLPVTCTKDFHMVELWDDRCVQVVTNLGVPVAL